MKGRPLNRALLPEWGRGRRRQVKHLPVARPAGTPAIAVRPGTIDAALLSLNQDD